MKIVEPSAELLWATPEAENMIEIAGRTCYKSEPKVFSDCSLCHGTNKAKGTIGFFFKGYSEKIGNDVVYYSDCPKCYERSAQEFIQKILKNGHHSVLEHASASFRVICDRGISHEFVRHRIFSYSQESSRYCNYSSDKFGNEITVIQPLGLHQETFEYADWVISCQSAERSYFSLISRGVSPQVARSVLPTCLKTEIVATTNFRSWRNFLKLRLDKAAHPDMIVIAKLICAELKKVAPTVFGDFDA